MNDYALSRRARVGKKLTQPGGTLAYIPDLLAFVKLRFCYRL